VTPEDAVLAALQAGPLPGSAVARRAHLRWRTAFAVLRSLARAGSVVYEGKAPASRFRLSVRPVREVA